MHRLLALLAVASLAACQNYQFKPVGRCLLQPGEVSVSTAAAIDILFVVDDSLSMDKIQASLATNFGAFIGRLAEKQRERVAAGKEPFDFYVAVTSTSVRVNRQIASNGSCGRVTPGKCSIDSVTTPPARAPYTYDCTSGPCGDLVTSYYNYVGSNCRPGVLRTNGDPYPAGDFVAAGSNPKVLAFTRDLNWRDPASDATIQGLIARFRENVQVGSCGANQEMPFEAARLAIQKAKNGQQGVVWPHAGSKVAVIFVGNEDDCSTKPANQGGLVWDGQQAGEDSCHADAQRATPLALTPSSTYETFLERELGHPLVAAFVHAGFADCGGANRGTRMRGLATALAAAGASTVEASVCGPFADSLARIADELSPPDRLTLPTPPASGAVTQLRVEDADGKTVHLCDGPDPAGEWWFVDCASSPPEPLRDGRTDACIQLAPGSACEPDPGQTLRAEYLGRIPSSGCADAQGCASALGGRPDQWICEGATATQRGTCLCARN